MAYQTLQRALEESRSGKAISRDVYNVSVLGKTYPAYICVNRRGDVAWVFKSCPSIKMSIDKPSVRELDNVREWEPY